MQCASVWPRASSSPQRLLTAFYVLLKNIQGLSRKLSFSLPHKSNNPGVSKFSAKLRTAFPNKNQIRHGSSERQLNKSLVAKDFAG